MNYILGALLGYILHDAVKPTAVGNLLKNLELPADTFVNQSGGAT